MSGSGASNLGYGGSNPFSNVSGALANKYNAHDSASFTSKQIPIDGKNTNHGVYDNVKAASGTVNSLGFFKGGGCGCSAKRGGSSLSKKLKNIARQYKGGSKKMRTRRRASLRRRFKRSGARSRRSRKFYGGATWSGPYQQFGSNVANTRGYSTGGPMPIDHGKNIWQANPPPIKSYIGGRRRRSMRGGAGVPQLSFTPCTKGCMDFYNHNTQSCGKLPYM